MVITALLEKESGPKLGILPGALLRTAKGGTQEEPQGFMISSTIKSIHPQKPIVKGKVKFTLK